MAGKEMSIRSRREYLAVMQERYRVADHDTKSQLLDDMEAVTHLSRKHLTTLMGQPDLRLHKRSRERQRTYDGEVIAAITQVADTLGWVCAERLQPRLRATAIRLVACGEMEATTKTLDDLGRISVSTVARILADVRPTDRLPRAYPGRQADTEVQKAVPIALIPWNELEPGHFEVDLVHHGVPDEHGQLGRHLEGDHGLQEPLSHPCS